MRRHRTHADAGAPLGRLDETIGRLGKVLGLLIQWPTCHATLYPDAEENVAELARRLDSYLMGRRSESWLEWVSPELIDHVQETRSEAKRLAAKLGMR